MKKRCSNTNGWVLTKVCLLVVAFFLILYLKWWFCDREKEIEYRQLTEMQSYHDAEIRHIGDAETLVITK